MTYFVQPCPTCGRSLQIRLQYLGKKVVCRHCQGSLVAWDPDEPIDPEDVIRRDAMARADALLSTFDRDDPSNVA